MDTEERTVVTEGYEERTVGRRSWSPGQFVAAAIGLFLVVMGGVALARLLPTDSLTGETVTVLGVGHTTLMAIIAIGLGLLFLVQAGAPFDVQPSLITLGVVSIAFGLVVVIEPNAFDNALGLGSGGGWLYTAIGVLSVLTGVVSPTLTSRRVS